MQILEGDLLRKMEKYYRKFHFDRIKSIKSIKGLPLPPPLLHVQNVKNREAG